MQAAHQSECRIRLNMAWWRLLVMASGALSVATRGYVMESGRIVLSDTAAQLMQDARVAEAYLGA